MNDCTDYVLAVLEAHPTTAILRLSPTAYVTFDFARLPAGVTVLGTNEDYCECTEADGTLLIRFRV